MPAVAGIVGSIDPIDRLLRAFDLVDAGVDRSIDTAWPAGSRRGVAGRRVIASRAVSRAASAAVREITLRRGPP